MKHVFMPILRIIVFLTYILVGVPILSILALLIALWHFDFRGFKWFFAAPFMAESEPVFRGEKYWVYNTCVDYLLNIKSYVVKEDGIDINGIAR